MDETIVWRALGNVRQSLAAATLELNAIEGQLSPVVIPPAPPIPPIPTPPPIPVPPAPPPIAGDRLDILAFLGPVTPQSAATTAYDTAFATHSDGLWTVSGPTWKPSNDANYYDRVASYYAMYARTGNPIYLTRGHDHLISYRENYLAKNGKNGWESLPNEYQPDGLYLHWVLTKDDRTYQAIIGGAAYMELAYLRWFLSEPQNDRSFDHRICIRVALAFYIAYLTGDTSRPWLKYLTQTIQHTLTKQSADGSWRWASAQGAALNYMAALACDGLIRIRASGVVPAFDAPIETCVMRAVAFWQTQVVPSPKGISLHYADKSYDTGKAKGGPGPTVDLNNLYLSTLSWHAEQSGDTSARDLARQLYPVWLAGASLYLPKQFGEGYYSSYRGLAGVL